MHISPRTVDLQSPLVTRPAFGGYMPWSIEAPPPGPVLPQPTAVCAARDEEIVAQDDEAEHCYMVVSGCVRTVRLMQDGRRQIGEFLFPGDIFGWDALDKHDFGAEAVTQVTLHRYSRGGLAALADKDCTLSRRIRKLTAMQVRAGREHMILLGRMDCFRTDRQLPPGDGQANETGRTIARRTSDGPHRHRRLSRSDNRDGLPPAYAASPGWGDHNQWYEDHDS